MGGLGSVGHGGEVGLALRNYACCVGPRGLVLDATTSRATTLPPHIFHTHSTPEAFGDWLNLHPMLVLTNSHLSTLAHPPHATRFRPGCGQQGPLQHAHRDPLLFSSGQRRGRRQAVAHGLRVLSGRRVWRKCGAGVALADIVSCGGGGGIGWRSWIGGRSRRGRGCRRQGGDQRCGDGAEAQHHV